ncbi:hypothetical protein MKY96_33480 [Paenibacillus sp. FSL R7-0302]|uniref:hypothetical protein n=1 Tax=Paenibacillus sp. FSL R7-0302 TaxID=2921681 RepID=UPI0030F80DD7
MFFVINPDPREVIEEYIPLNVRALLAKEITDAYQWSELIFNNTAAFKSLRGRYKLLPEIKNLAVEFLMMQASKSGKLPLKYRTGYNSNHSHSFTELYDDNVLLHFNQVKSKNKCGRKAYCRDRLVKPVQSYFDIEDNSLVVEENVQKYFQVNHGYQSETPLFISLGIPNSMGILEGRISLLDEITVIEGARPVSQVKEIDDFDFEDFQRFAEGAEENDKQQSS